MSLKDVPESHPRYHSLLMREKIAHGVEIGVTSIHGLIAHGRGEAFNYLVGEKTQSFAEKAIEVAAAKLCLAKQPVISVNGNSVALAAEELVVLSQITKAPLEVNIFHTSGEREIRIAQYLGEFGASEVLLPEQHVFLDCIDSNRRFINARGIAKADLVFVPLEDGDRCEALVSSGREVITVDLNPVSRTAKTSTVTIVDELCRALPRLIEVVKEYKNLTRDELFKKIDAYSNSQVLKSAQDYIANNFSVFQS